MNEPGRRRERNHHGAVGVRADVSQVAHLADPLSRPAASSGSMEP
jgi:hypothetical protein